MRPGLAPPVCRWSPVSAESVCATRSSMPRTCQSDPGPRQDNISAHLTAHAQRVAISTLDQPSTEPCPDHSDNDNAFWPFCRIFSCFQCYFGGEQIDRRSRHLHILSFLTAWNPKYCVYLTIRLCWTRGEMSPAMSPPHSVVTNLTSASVWRQWPVSATGHSDRGDRVKVI